MKPLGHGRSARLSLTSALVALALWALPTGNLAFADDPDPVRETVARIVNEADAGHDAGSMILPAADLGIQAAIECARRFDPQKPKRNAALLEVIALAAQSRRSHPELLKLYDPDARRLFYSEAGATDQRMIGSALALEIWPAKVPEAMVRAAPLATLDWMHQQAKSEKPRLAELIAIWQTWGFWARAGHERQYLPTLEKAAQELAENRAIRADAPTVAALVRFIGECKARGATPFVVASLTHESPAVRAAAASACARLASDEALTALIKASATENDPAPQQKIAMAFETWANRTEAGDALLALFTRTPHAAVRREALFSAAHATWPRRKELLKLAFEKPVEGVLGAALVALHEKPEPALLPDTLEIAAHTDDAQPALIDALASFADARAAPHLTRWLSKQENSVLKVKLLLALEKCSNHEADAWVLKLAKEDASAMVVEQALGIVGRKQVKGAEDLLLALAGDADAPPQVRVEAIWAMGRFDTPAIRQLLRNLGDQTEKYFHAGGANQMPEEAIDIARLMAALAEIRLGVPDADARLQKAFDRTTGTGQLTALVMLAQMKRDHPIIPAGLESTDTAIVLGAARAAAAVASEKYLAKLRAIRNGKFIDALLNSGLDSAGLRGALDDAILAGEKR